MKAVPRGSTDRLHVIAGGYEAILLPWPDMRAFRRPLLGLADWEAFEPDDFRVPGDGTLPACYGSGDELQRFVSHVPHGLAARVARFPDDHWALLSWVARAGVAGDDLLDSNPCLALMLARAPAFAARARRTMPVWALRPYAPQKTLLGRLGFPAAESMRRIVRRVVFSAMSIPRLTAVRTAMRRAPDLLSRLSHVQRLNANVLAAVAGGGLQVTPRLLAHLSAAAEDDPGAPLGAAIADTVRGCRLLHPRGPFPVFDSVEQIRRLHEQVVEELAHYRGSGLALFPPPPVAGTDTIVPLQDLLALITEGREQHNCVASYARLARRGEVAIYKVTAPGRATLSLVPDGSRWKVSELWGPCNTPVSARTRDEIRRWLAGTPDPGRIPPPAPGLEQR